MTQPKLQVKNCDLFYGDFQALKNINLSIAEKEITAFIGPSGCGKSTLLKSLNRMNDLVEGCKITGDFTLDGENIYNADRVGMACKDDKGEWVLINGNQTCLIFLYYIIKNRIAMGKMQPNDFIVKTIVTTELIKAVADKNKIEMRDCYTGFKWIAREIRLSEGKQQYIGGGEESYGFLAEDFVRDKDAVSACSLLAEICAWAKDQGKTLYDVLMEIYVEYGFSKETTVNVVKPGKSGAEEIKAMMDNFRANPPKEIGGSAVPIEFIFTKAKVPGAAGIK